MRRFPNDRKNSHSVRRGKIPSKDPSEWAGRMADIPCFILGNGPSLEDIDLSPLNEFFTIGINRIFYTYDPTILMWQDLALWIQENKKIIETKAIKYCREGSEFRGGFYTFSLGKRDPRISHGVKVLHGRGSSGTIAYQFAFSLGCNPIICVGMDCKYEGKMTDFYGNNPMHKPHTLPNCKKGLKFIMGNHPDKTIINCSDTDILGKRHTLQEAISLLGDKRYNREILTNILFNVEK